MSYVIVGCLCGSVGFLIAALFDAQSYDQGFDDGWRQRGIFDKHEEGEDE